MRILAYHILLCDTVLISSGWYAVYICVNFELVSSLRAVDVPKRSNRISLLFLSCLASINSLAHQHRSIHEDMETLRGCLRKKVAHPSLQDAAVGPLAPLLPRWMGLCSENAQCANCLCDVDMQLPNQQVPVKRNASNYLERV